MKLVIGTMLLGTVGLILTSTGCGGGSDLSSGASSGALAPAECDGMSGGVAKPDGKDAEPQGPRATIGAALQKVCLTDDQRTKIQEIGERVSKQEDAVNDARHDLRVLLLDGLDAGQIDESKLNEKIDALVKARVAASPVLRKGLEDLHGLLDSGQRAALVDAMQARIHDLMKDSDGWLDNLATDLSLSADQKQRVGDLLAKAKPELEEEREIAKKALEAFKTDDFAMEKILPIAEVGDRTKTRITRMIGTAKELVGIMTPEQRDKINVLIEGKSNEATAPAAAGASGPATSMTAEGTLGSSRQAVVVARRGYRAGVVGGWGGRGVVVGGRTTVVVANPTPYVVGYPVVPGYGPGIW